MERKLAATLSVDVQGYRRLMGEDDEATICTLTVRWNIRSGSTLYKAMKWSPPLFQTLMKSGTISSMQGQNRREAFSDRPFEALPLTAGQ